MKISVFATKDLAAQTFMQPMFAQHSGSVIRGFSDAVNNVGNSAPSDISNHPDDFELYELGSFDPDYGTLFSLEAPKLLSRGVDVKLIK